MPGALCIDLSGPLEIGQRSNTAGLGDEAGEDPSPPLPRCRAPGAGGGSHGGASSAPLARGWSRRHPREARRRAQPVRPSSRSPAPSARTRTKAPPALARIGPTPPSAAGTPAGGAPWISASPTPPSQASGCLQNRA